MPPARAKEALAPENQPPKGQARFDSLPLPYSAWPAGKLAIVSSMTTLPATSARSSTCAMATTSSHLVATAVCASAVRPPERSPVGLGSGAGRWPWCRALGLVSVLNTAHKLAATYRSHSLAKIGRFDGWLIYEG